MAEREESGGKKEQILEDLDIFLLGGRVSAHSVLVMLSQHGVVIELEDDLPPIFNNADELVGVMDYVKKLEEYSKTEPLI